MMTVRFISAASAALLLLAVGWYFARPPAKEARGTVLVAKRKVPAFTHLKGDLEDWFDACEVPASNVPKGAVTNLVALRYTRVAREVPEGALIKLADLYDGEGSLVGNGLPPGARAIDARVRSGSLDEGIVPGVRVDVLGTFVEGKEPRTVFLARDILVGAITQAPPRADEGVQEVGIVTLIVIPETAQRIVLGEAIGNLRIRRAQEPR
jgi:Flp pilus assembly protein CpaB